MSVRLQLFFFTLLMFILFGVCIAANFIFFAPRFELQRQYELFGEVAAATANLEIEANRLLYNDIIIQKTKFSIAAERYAKTRSDMGTVISLKGKNEFFSDSIASVDHLYDQNAALIEGVENRLTGLVETLDGPAPVNGWTLDSIIFGDLLAKGRTLDSFLFGELPVYDDAKMRNAQDIRLFVADIHVLSEYLSTSRQTVEQQSRAVNQEIGRLGNRANFLIAIVVVLTVLISLVMAYRIASSIIAQNERSKDDLKRAQNKLVASEKLSALGHLAAGIAHELNSPLGAIVSANGSVNRYLTERLVPAIGFIEELNSEERAALKAIFSARIIRPPSIEFGPASSEVTAAAKKLAAMGLSPSDTLAELAAERGFEGLLETMPALFAMPRCAELLAFARDHYAAIGMADVISLASSQAADVVSALRQYLSNSDEDEFHEVDIEKSIDMVLTLIQNKIKYGIKIERHFCGAKVLGSSQKLGQVWMNLITNAVHAMNRNGTLVLSSKIDNGLLEVIVQDDGTGIPPEIKDRIFEPFFTTKRVGEGLGLGLDICLRIVHAHSGTIDVESQPGNTRFIVRLPLSGPGEKKV